MPAIELATDDGALSLAAQRGRVVWLDYWASWCGPCRRSFPWMNAMHERYADRA
jgi:thiol-disulfide isomerase/thioredoxin